MFCHRALISTGHIFSPNEREAASLVGAGTPLEMIGRLSKLGAEVYVYTAHVLQIVLAKLTL